MFFVCSYVFTVYDCSNCMHVKARFALFSILLFHPTVFLHFTEQINDDDDDDDGGGLVP